MDAIDRKMLAELQADGRLTVTELAQRVRSAWRRATGGCANWSGPG